MAYVKRVRHDRAKGVLKREYDAAVRRAGKVFHIVDVQSLNPEALRDGMRLYVSIMKGKSDLTRAQRELAATVVSAANGCLY